MKKLFVNLSISLITLLICFLVLEVGCRIFYPDRMLRYGNDPELLFRYEPNQSGFHPLNNGDTSPPVRINSLGLRGAEPLESDGSRILFLGDSFTFGWGVEEAAAYPARVGQGLSGYTAFNAGQPGFGAFQMEILMRRLMPVLKPKVVVIMIWEGMLSRRPPTPEERSQFFEKSSLLKDLKKLSVFGTHMYRMLTPLLARIRGEQFTIVMARHPGDPNSSHDPVEWITRDEQYISAMAALAKAQESQPVVVFWPHKGFDNEKKLERSEEIQKKLESLTKRERIPFISLMGAFDGVPPEKMEIPGDLHPNGTGHCFVSRAVLSGLEALLHTEVSLPAC